MDKKIGKGPEGVLPSNRSVTAPTAIKYKKMLRRTWRTLFRLSLAILALAAMGMLCQIIVTALDKRIFLPPGQLVDVGGHRLHLHSLGESPGGPTVLLEAGLGGFSAQWAWVQPQIARFTRVIAYDRAGLGWSERSTQPNDAQHVAQQFHTALARAGQAGPYVLVGHALGGMHVRVFADRYPDEVAGMVLVDTVEGVLEELPEQSGQELQALGKRTRLLPVLARFGVLGLVDVYPQVAYLPAESRAACRAFFSSVDHLTALREELPQQGPHSATAVQVSHTRPLGNWPLVVLSRSVPADAITRAYQSSHAELAARSARGMHRIVEGADHLSLVTRAEYAQSIIEAVRQVVDATYGENKSHLVGG